MTRFSISSISLRLMWDTSILVCTAPPGRVPFSPGRALRCCIRFTTPCSTCRAVAAAGLPAWLAEYEEKADLLTVALERYNNGRMKRYLCELFLQRDLETLRQIMARAESVEEPDPKARGLAFQALLRELPDP